MLVYYFVPFIVSNRYLLFWVSNGHNSITVQNRTHVYMKFFDHKGLGNHLLQLCPKVVKHPVYCLCCLYTGYILDSTWASYKLTVTLFSCSSCILRVTRSCTSEWRLITARGIYWCMETVPTWRLHSCVETLLPKGNRVSLSSCMYFYFRNATQSNGPHLNLEPFTEPVTDINKRRPRCVYSSNTYCTCPSQAVLESVPLSRASLS